VTVPVSEIAQQRTVRLIPTAYYKPAVLRALVDTDDELEQLERLEGLTSGRLIGSSVLVIMMHGAEPTSLRRLPTVERAATASTMNAAVLGMRALTTALP
jgi:hypothetical protein